MGKLPFEAIKREVLTRREAETSPKFGKKPEERTTEELISYGVINIDKPKGPTSHQVSAYVKQIMLVDKSGHSGTLDPKVTGSLIVALDKVTKVTQGLLTAGKEYVAIMHLHDDLDEYTIHKACADFIGKIKQMPPIKSSVKRQMRVRSIYYLDIMEVDGRDVLFRVGTEAGTYIRKLCLHTKTEILSEKGLMTASDFYSNPQNVFSFSKGKMIEKKPSAIQRFPSPTKLIKISMSSGIDLIATPDHKLLVSKKEGYKMIEAQALNKEDYLVKSLRFPTASKNFVITDLLDDSYLIPQKDIKDKCKQALISKHGSIRAMYCKLNLDRKAFLTKSNNAITIKHLKLAGIYEQVKKNINIFKTQKGTTIKMRSLNGDFFYLLGLVASDGNNTKEKKTVRHTRIKFHNKNEELINHFLKTYKKLFPNVPISKKKIRPNLYQLDSTNSFFATIAASLGVKSPQKNSDLLPIANAHSNLIKSFLKGYFDGDGSVYYQKTKKNCKTRISLYSVSSRDADRLHKMLLKVAIPNKIFRKKVSSYGRVYDMYEVAIENIPAEKRFIKRIGTNHPKKMGKFKKILNLKYDSGVYNHCYVGLHYKNEIRKNKTKLHKMGGNLNRVLTSNIPVTRGFYKKASKIIKLPSPNKFIIERIKSIKEVKGTDYVYDMTVPKTHNFLIETGFVSSNCHDIGQKLGSGAHMAELRRTKVGPFEESTLVTMQNLQDAFWLYKNKDDDSQLRKFLQPMENAIAHLPKIWVMDTTVNSLCHGAILHVPGIAKLESNIEPEQLVAIMTLKGELIATARAKMNSNGMVKAERGIAAKSERVFMEPDVYPRIEKA